LISAYQFGWQCQKDIGELPFTLGNKDKKSISKRNFR